MVDAARARKLASRIQEIVAETLRLQVKDPRLGMATITDTRITPDLRDATVYYTVLGEPEEVKATARALESAKGVLRSAIGKGTGVRFTPTLTFKLDTVPEQAASMEELLERARLADEEVLKRSTGASYAGDADPYRD
ncbi:MAG: 30S ribosome-binding factor RbfA [Corynebacteriales bacterium]|nr:30S ribosome-binding factor RbfA [Mycobacteriales bacterium]